jgi:hypothetical protein
MNQERGDVYSPFPISLISLGGNWGFRECDFLLLIGDMSCVYMFLYDSWLILHDQNHNLMFQLMNHKNEFLKKRVYEFVWEIYKFKYEMMFIWVEYCTSMLEMIIND